MKALVYSVDSWSATASLGAVMRDAKYLKHEEEIFIPPGMLMDSSNVQEIKFLPGFNLEGYFNRDSTQYIFAYGIPTAHTVQRGTLRYKVRTKTSAHLGGCKAHFVQFTVEYHLQKGSLSLRLYSSMVPRQAQSYVDLSSFMIARVPSGSYPGWQRPCTIW